MLAVKTLAPNHILTRIVDAKRERLSRTKMRVPEAVVKHFALKVPPQRSFREALLTSDHPVRIIAEIKKASPSKGVITEHFSAQALADIYARAGASAISAVTEEDFFQGNIGWIEDIRKIADLPVLRKDFVFDAYQVYETRGAKASAILLIVAMLRPEELHSLLGVTQNAGLDALVEVHNEEELREAIDAGADIIGVNNRDLKTFDVDIQTSRRLAPLIPENCIFVVESGIQTRADIEGLLAAGADAFLIGETLIAAQDTEAKLRCLL